MNRQEKFMRNWIEQNFDTESVKVDYQHNRAVLTDNSNEQMTVEMIDNVLYADKKPFASIPSLAY